MIVDCLDETACQENLESSGAQRSMLPAARQTDALGGAHQVHHPPAIWSAGRCSLVPDAGNFLGTQIYAEAGQLFFARSAGRW
jgi:hypothetical protein